MLHKNKKAQIGETITWVVATVIIVAVIVISLYIVNILKQSKDYLNVIDNVISSVSGNKANRVSEADLLKEKSFDALLLFNNGGTIYDQIKASGNLNALTGNKAKDILTKIYGKSYSIIWLGIESKYYVLTSNSYFTAPPSSTWIQEQAEMNSDKNITLILAQENKAYA